MQQDVCYFCKPRGLRQVERLHLMFSLVESCSLSLFLAVKYTIYYNLDTSVLRGDHISLLVYPELPDFLKVNSKQWSSDEKTSFPFLFLYKTYFFQRIIHSIAIVQNSDPQITYFLFVKAWLLSPLLYLQVKCYTGFCIKALIKREVLSACFPIAELPRILPYVSSFSKGNMPLLRLV